MQIESDEEEREKKNNRKKKIKIKKMLGKGTFGTVYQGICINSGRGLAVKVSLACVV